MNRNGRSRTYRRAGVAAVALVAIGGLGVLFANLPTLFHVPSEVSPATRDLTEPGSVHQDVAGHVRLATEPEVRQRFDQAVAMLHAREYEHAITALHRVLELRPRMPEAHVNMGFALVGLDRFDAARDFFAGAMELNPAQANAYYGLAIAHEGLGELPEAVGAMRAYLHLADPETPYRRKAEAAIWEWSAAVSGHGARAPGVMDDAAIGTALSDGGGREAQP